jgi:hypothetical protein
LEPTNSFYDWALIYFLLCARRDTEALRVLDLGSRKPHYDDHFFDSIQASINAQEKVRPLLVEEKQQAVMSALLPHLAKMRHVSRILSWMAWQRQQSGDIQGALQIRSQLARLSWTMMRGKKPVDFFHSGASLHRYRLATRSDTSHQGNTFSISWPRTIAGHYAIASSFSATLPNTNAAMQRAKHGVSWVTSA